MKKLHKKILTFSLSILISGNAVNYIPSANAAEIQLNRLTDTLVQAEETQKIVTEYSDLWNGTIVFKTGVPAQWYVHVPDDTEPKGCSATIKIPGLGWGTEGKSKEEGHITLTQGDNLVYEFTPEQAGDYIFSCWMGTGCHSNYIHVTDDGTYSAAAPDDPANIHAERSGTSISISFDAPAVPEGVNITGYKIVAEDSDGKKTKKTVQENSAVLSDLREDSSYSVKIDTLATSGTSIGNDEVTVTPVSESTTAPAETTVPETAAAAETPETTSSAVQTTSTAKTTVTTTSKAASTTTTASSNSSSPKTGDHKSVLAELLLFSSLGTAFLFRKRRRNS